MIRMMLCSIRHFGWLMEVSLLMNWDTLRWLLRSRRVSTLLAWRVGGLWCFADDAQRWEVSQRNTSSLQILLRHNTWSCLCLCLYICFCNSGWIGPFRAFLYLLLFLSVKGTELSAYFEIRDLERHFWHLKDSNEYWLAKVATKHTYSYKN
jgi:hypothetical protein